MHRTYGPSFLWTDFICAKPIWMGPTKDRKGLLPPKDRKELSGTEKNLDMACYAIKTYVK